MKIYFALIIVVFTTNPIIAQDTLRITSALTGNFEIVSTAPIDSLPYQEEVSTTSDGGTQIFFSIQSSSQRLSAPPVIVSKPEIFPNPGEGVYSVSVPGASMLRIEVFTIVGTPVFEKKVNNINAIIDISHLSKGIYLFKITCSDGSLKAQRVIHR